MRANLTMQTTTPDDHLDVLIVGAGLSGIGAGYHLQQKCPGSSRAATVSAVPATCLAIPASALAQKSGKFEFG